MAKVGAYATANEEPLNWLLTPVKEPSQKTRRSKAVAKIVNPIFLKCAELMEDQFWKTTFIQAASGKFPRGYALKGENLTHRKNQKIESTPLTDNPSEVVATCLSFFHRFGIYSPDEQDNCTKQRQDSTERKSIYDFTWADICKRRRLLGILLDQYIVEKTKEMGKKQAENFASVLFRSLACQSIIKSVKYENGRILNIEGILQEGDEFFIDLKYIDNGNSKKSSKKNKDDENRDIFIENWSICIDHLLKDCKQEDLYLTNSVTETFEEA